MNSDITRESWLEDSVKLLSDIFENEGYTLPEVKVSCSWPGGRGNKCKTIGQCWPKSASGAKINEIFISPTISDPLAVLAVMAHELIHAVDDCLHGHRKEFTKIMRAI